MITITVAAIPFLLAIAIFLIALFAYSVEKFEGYMPLVFIGVSFFTYFMFYGVFAACGGL